VIDLMGLINLFSRNKMELLSGNRYNMMIVQIDALFQSLSSMADLVFFKDGPVNKDKLFVWTERQNQKQIDFTNVLELIYEGIPIKEILDNVRFELPNVTFLLDAIEDRASKYGKLVVAVTKECDTELARYASNNDNVLAILADDSDFLIFPGKWRYFSINNLDLTNLNTKEFNRKALREFLDLNDKQLIILSSIGGNDIVRYEQVRMFHKHKFGTHNAQHKFPAIAAYIKNELPMGFNELIRAIGYEVLRDTHNDTLYKIDCSLSQYNTVSLPQELFGFELTHQTLTAIHAK